MGKPINIAAEELRLKIDDAMKIDIATMTEDSIMDYYANLLRKCSNYIEYCIRRNDHKSVQVMISKMRAIKEEMSVNIQSIKEFEPLRKEILEKKKQEEKEKKEEEKRIVRELELQKQKEEAQAKKLLELKERDLFAEQWAKEMYPLFEQMLKKKMNNLVEEVSNTLQLIDVSMTIVKIYKNKISSEEQLISFGKTLDKHCMQLFIDNKKTLTDIIQ